MQVRRADETGWGGAGARRGRHAAELPERLRTRDWDSVVAVLLAVDESLVLSGSGLAESGRAGAGWKIGAASDEIRRAERLPGLFPALEIGDTVFRDWYGSSGHTTRNGMNPTTRTSAVSRRRLAAWRRLRNQ